MLLVILITVVATLVVGGSAGYLFYLHKKSKIGKGIKERVDYVSLSMYFGFLGGRTIHPVIEDEYQTGSYVQLRGRKCLDCRTTSYLKLDLLKSVKDRAKLMVERYGTGRCVTQMYFKLPLIGQLVEMLEKITTGNVLIASSVTSGHFAVIPVLVAPYFNSLIVLDRRVHNSVTLATQICQGNTTIRLNHNDMGQLEGLLKKHRSVAVWYFCDGIYSMSGAGAPVEELVRLLRTYPNLHVYCDDAHGTLWCHNAGYFLSELLRLNVDIQAEFGDRLIVALALGKTFSAGGGAFVFSGKRSQSIVRGCGPTLTFNTVVNPSELGAAIEVCEMALRGDLAGRQQRLRHLIEFRESELRKLELVRNKVMVPTDSISPITVIYFNHTPEMEKLLQRFDWINGFGFGFFACQVCDRLQDTGYLCNVTAFPAVAVKQAGVRLAIHTEMSEDEVRGTLLAVQEAYNHTMKTIGTDEVFEEFQSRTQRARRELNIQDPKSKDKRD